MKSIFLSCVILSHFSLFGQGRVGIGTTTPATGALVDMTSDNKGVLFPRMTTAQRNMIINPPDGLHIYNTDHGCLNYYDNRFQIWNCYCVFDTCHTVTIAITENVDHEIDFLDEYASRYPGQLKFKVVVDSNIVILGDLDTVVILQLIGVVVSGSGINFDSMPAGTEVLLVNYGVIVGRGGVGGRGAGSGDCGFTGMNGAPAGHGIVKDGSVSLTIHNYGLIAGGGGGGGGGGGNGSNQGGGGGGGAGFGVGALGGGINTISGGFPQICLFGAPIASSGANGLDTAGGTGGAGANGGGTGGNGGFLGMPGTDGSSTNFGTAGPGGKAISGSGAVLTNLGGGLVIGVVD